MENIRNKTSISAQLFIFFINGLVVNSPLLQNGFCFVEFDDNRDADDACHEMNGRDLLGDRVTVEIARGTPHGRDREKWGSGSGGNGGGRDRRDGGNIIFILAIKCILNRSRFSEVAMQTNILIRILKKI